MRRDDIATLLASRTFLTFAGTETYLVFVQQHPLREFCAFEVVDDEPAWQRMEDGLLRPIADVAAERGLGLIADCLVWRASTDYVNRLGHGDRGVAGVNRDAVARTRRFIEEWRGTGAAARAVPVIVSGDLGPRGDGYAAATDGVSSSAAADYHRPQIDALAASGVDLLVALTMTTLEEAIGIVRAATEAGLPVLLSPTVETDGRTPDGRSLGDFVTAVDDATSGAPIGYLVNCAHPTHIDATLAAAADRGEGWLVRFRGMRANASTKSHAELDNSTELDRGDPRDLARRMKILRDRFGFTIVGGCCGTDAEHMRAIAAACA